MPVMSAFVRLDPPRPGPRAIPSMHLQADAPLAADEVRVIERRFSERSHRLGKLLDLDQALSDAANRHNLAADIVHFGWPVRAD